MPAVRIATYGVRLSPCCRQREPAIRCSKKPAIIHIAPSSTPARQERVWTAGTMIGPYQVRERLGAGGMGEVSRALDTRLRRDVALKTLPESLSRDRSYVERLRPEALALASVNHRGGRRDCAGDGTG